MSRRPPADRSPILRTDRAAVAPGTWIAGGMEAIHAAFTRLADEFTDRLVVVVEAEIDALGLRHSRSARLRDALRGAVIERLLGNLGEQVRDNRVEPDVIARHKVQMTHEMLIDFLATHDQ